MRFKRKPNFKNRPPHQTHNAGYYFITSRTVSGQWYLRPDKYKTILLKVIKEKTKKFGCPLIAYAILNNHYHLILNVKNNNLPKLMREINGASAYLINCADAVIKRKIWWNYFDKCLRDEKDFFIHLNYIHQNPVKHGISQDLNCEFSSYKSWVAKKGQDYVDDCFRNCPVADFLVFKDDF